MGKDGESKGSVVCDIMHNSKIQVLMQKNNIYE